ncbi:MAG: hypothetical protein ACK5LN_00980 [Propioniciclava sp.]
MAVIIGSLQVLLPWVQSLAVRAQLQSQVEDTFEVTAQHTAAEQGEQQAIFDAGSVLGPPVYTSVR